MNILKKNKYILSKENPNPNHPYYDLYITLGTIGKLFEVFSHFEMDFGTSRTSLRKISTFLRKTSQFFTKICTFFPRGTRTLIMLIKTYMFLWEPSKSDLRYSPICTYLRKISTFFTKIHTFFPRGVESPITHIMNYIFLWGRLRNNLRHSLTLKWTLEPQYIFKKNKYILTKNKYILKKNKYILFKGNPDPNNPYYDLYITFKTHRKWFEAFPHPEMDFGTPWIFLKKNKYILKKKYIYFL